MGAVLLSKREQPALSLAPYDPIEFVRVLGNDAPAVELRREQLHFTIGAHDGCDVAVPPHLARGVGEVHASMERVDDGLLIRDLGSTNGTFASRRGPRTDVLLVRPGDTFWIADVPIRVTDRYLEALRAHVGCHVGLLNARAIDTAVADVASGEPLLLRGPLGTGARRLAAAIHATSPQRDNPRIMGFAPGVLLQHAHGCTVFIDLDHVDVLWAPYASALFDPARGLRVIFASSNEARARARLQHYRDRLRTIDLVPLAQRREDVPHLVQFYWSTELESCERVEDLGADAIASLERYDWPRNLDELFAHAPRIHAYHVLGGLRRAAAALGVKHQTLADHFARIGFPILDQHERAMIEPSCRTTRRLARP